jgi:hypothetical protein
MYNDDNNDTRSLKRQNATFFRRDDEGKIIKTPRKPLERNQDSNKTDKMRNEQSMRYQP